MARGFWSSIAKLRALYGAPRPPISRDPFVLILYENIAYLASDEKRNEAFALLRCTAGLTPRSILAAPQNALVAACRVGGIYPDVRAQRLRDTAELAASAFDGDLRGSLRLPYAESKKALKRFPSIGDPGADKILLFCGAAATPAPDSNGLRVLTRLGYGTEVKSYAATYRSAVEAVAAETGSGGGKFIEAHQLLRRHGQEICRRTRPECERCPLRRSCDYYAKRPATKR
jgi:endonuclease III